MNLIQGITKEQLIGSYESGTRCFKNVFLLGGTQLNNANLSGIDLSGSDLGYVNLSGTNFGSSVFKGADFEGADLSGADLNGSDLSGASLGGVNLNGANLSRANLVGAYLGGACLVGADLSRTDLRHAVFYEAVLENAILTSADLIGASFSYADLRGVKPSYDSAHAFWGELLAQKATTHEQELLACAILAGNRFAWCWDHFQSWNHPLQDWALEVIKGFGLNLEDCPSKARILESARHTKPSDIGEIHVSQSDDEIGS